MLGVFIGLDIHLRQPRPTTPAVLAVLGGIAMATVRDSSPIVLGFITLGIAGVAIVVAFAGWLLVGQADSEREQQVFVIGSLLLLGGAAAYASLSAVFAGLLAGIVWFAQAVNSPERVSCSISITSSIRSSLSCCWWPAHRSPSLSRRRAETGDRRGAARGRAACRGSVSGIGRSCGDCGGARRVSRSGAVIRLAAVVPDCGGDGGDSPAWALRPQKSRGVPPWRWVHADRRAGNGRVSATVPIAASHRLSVVRPAGWTLPRQRHHRRDGEATSARHRHRHDAHRVYRRPHTQHRASRATGSRGGGHHRHHTGNRYVGVSGVDVDPWPWLPISPAATGTRSS